MFTSLGIGIELGIGMLIQPVIEAETRIRARNKTQIIIPLPHAILHARVSRWRFRMDIDPLFGLQPEDSRLFASTCLHKFILSII